MLKLISPSEMKKMFKENSDKRLSSVGKKWYPEEKEQMIKELEEGLSIEQIAVKHNRSFNGIYFKIKEHAYNLYLKNIPIEEIIQKSKLSKQEIEDAIFYYESKNKEKKQKKINKKEEKKEENDINEIKKDIQEIKKDIKELIEMIKAIYEFED